MKKSVLVTGVSGSGKSTLSHTLRAMGYPAYDIDDIEGLFMMLDKQTGQPVVDHDNDNLEKVENMDWVCDVEKLKKLMADEKSDVAFYCGSASNLNDLIPLFDVLILLEVSPETMRRRLSSRVSNDFGRTPEVQEWLFSWKDEWETYMKGKGAIVIDANKDKKEVAAEVLERIVTK